VARHLARRGAHTTQSAHYAGEGSGRQALVGFGDDGTGNPFCIRRDGGEAVYYWSPLDQEATLLAEDAAEFWRLWTANELPAH
jgi:hypothetical protein